MFLLNAKGDKFWLNNEGIHFQEVEMNFDKKGKGVKTATAFIQFCCAKTRTPSKHVSSYGYKHKAESFGKEFNGFFENDSLATYVTNGEFIYAAKMLGIQIYTVRNSINCYFNLRTLR